MTGGLDGPPCAGVGTPYMYEAGVAEILEEYLCEDTLEIAGAIRRLGRVVLVANAAIDWIGDDTCFMTLRFRCHGVSS